MISFSKEINDLFENYMNDLQKLVSHNSILDLSTAGEGKPFGQANYDVLQEMLAIGVRDGYQVKNVDGYAGHIDIGNGDEVIGVLGHLDIVPVNEVGWDSDPFHLTLKDGKLYGRGTSDDKGPLLAAYYAAKMIQEKGLSTSKKIRIIFGCNEESGSKCMRYYFTKEPYPNLGFTPDANFPVIYGEKKGAHFGITGNLPTEGIVSFKAGTVANIVPERATAIIRKSANELQESFQAFIQQYGLKGSIEECEEGCKIELVGKSSHASLPHLGKNAAVYLGSYLNTIIDHPLTKLLDQYFAEDYSGEKLGIAITGMMGPLTCNVGICNFENGEVKIILDCRCPHELDNDSTKVKVETIMSQFALKTESYFGTALYVDPQSELIQGLHKAYVECTGDTEAKPIAIGGGTYAKTMPNCVAFGPEFEGTDNQIHQNNEFAVIDQIKLEMEIYANALYNLAK